MARPRRSRRARGSIEACAECAQTCVSCADACLSEEHRRPSGAASGSTSTGADICDATGRVLTRQTEYGAALSKAQVETCRQACATCAEECQRHAEMHEHCRICGESCRGCEHACTELLDAMK